MEGVAARVRVGDSVTHYSKQWANLALTEEVLLGLKAGEQRGGTWRHMLREAK